MPTIGLIILEDISVFYKDTNQYKPRLQQILQFFRTIKNTKHNRHTDAKDMQPQVNS